MARPKAGYPDAAGNKYKGSSTLAKIMGDSGGLIQWAYKQGQAHEAMRNRGEDAPAHLYDQVERAGSIGTTVHNMVEAHINGQDIVEIRDLVDAEFLDDKDAHDACFSGYRAFLEWFEMTGMEVIAQEIPLVDPALGYGGTFDAIGRRKGKLELLDWKTGAAIYPEMLAQIASYGHLAEHGFELGTEKKLGYKIEGYHLCRFSKEHGDFSHHYFPKLDDAWEAFKLCLKLDPLKAQLKKRAK